MQINEGVATEFVVTQLAERSLSDFLGQDVLHEFGQLVRDGKDIAATQRYQQVTGASIQQAHFAVGVARRFLA